MGTAQSSGAAAMSSEEQAEAFRLERLSERETWLERFRPDALCDFSVLSSRLAAEQSAAQQLVSLRGGETEGRCVGALLGLAVGDALGAPLEFSPVRYGSQQLLDMDQQDIWDVIDEGDTKQNKFGYNKFELKPGQWTDDTSMALCLADSLLACRGYSPLDLRLRFLNWWHFGYNNAFAKDEARRTSETGGGSCGLGGNIAASLKEFVEDHQEHTASGDRCTSGNGSLMRLAPCAIFFRKDHMTSLAVAERQSRTTHQGDEAAQCCRFLAHLLFGAFQASSLMGAGAAATALPRASSRGRSPDSVSGRGSPRTQERGGSAGRVSLPPLALAKAKAEPKAKAKAKAKARSSPSPARRGLLQGLSLSPARRWSAQSDPGRTAAADAQGSVAAADLKHWLLGDWCASFESPLHSVSCLARSAPETLLTPEATSDFGLGSYTVAVSTLPVHKCADGQSEVLRKLPRDTVVQVDKNADGWLFLSEPVEGWLCGFVSKSGEVQLEKEGWQQQRNWNWKANDFSYAPKRAEKDPGYIGSYALDCLSMALHCVWSTDSFRAALLKAANLRGDADTVAAVTGQLAGAIYGASAIPKSWLKKLEAWDGGDIALRAWLLYHREDETLLARAVPMALGSGALRAPAAAATGTWGSLPRRDYSKLERNFAAAAKARCGKAWQPVVLLCTGSLCPVHRGHVDLFAHARLAIEAADPSLVVIGGFLSPSHDDYVQGKFGGTEHAAEAGWLDARHRLDLTRLAVADSDLVVADDWEAKQDAFVNWPQVVDALYDELRRLYPACRLLYLCGEDVGGEPCDDSAAPWGWGLCVVTRQDQSSLLERCGARGRHFVVQGAPEDLSSTLVRACFVVGRAEDARPQLHPQVYLQLRKMAYLRQEPATLRPAASPRRASTSSFSPREASPRQPASPRRSSTSSFSLAA